MTFTDDDLKQLKYRCDLKGSLEEMVACYPNEIAAIIARLESAEKALKFSLDEEEIVSGKMLDNAMEAWRKAKGEGE